MKNLLICSGGLDSAVLAYQLHDIGALEGLLTFDYGQRHRREIQFAAGLAKDLDVAWRLADISNLAALLSGSSLTDIQALPHGHYADPVMKATVVPNRNAIMLSIAFGAAAASGLEAVAMAVHAGDRDIYPDCRPGFLQLFNTAMAEAMAGMWSVQLRTPYLQIDKTAIVKLGVDLKVPFHRTWSCYDGGVIHCGRCGTCVERQEAMHQAGAQDDTQYMDSEYWRTVCEQAHA